MLQLALNHSTSLTILGIDPGYDRVGWGVVRTKSSELRTESFGCITTDKNQPLTTRYQQIDPELEEIIRKYKPQEAAVESLFFFKNHKTAMHVAEARGVIISCLFRNRVKFFEYTPLQIKQVVTGYGRADKKAVEKMVRMELKMKDERLKMKGLDDSIDALAVAMAHNFMS